MENAVPPSIERKASMRSALSALYEPEQVDMAREIEPAVLLMYRRFEPPFAANEQYERIKALFEVLCGRKEGVADLRESDGPLFTACAQTAPAAPFLSTHLFVGCMARYFGRKPLVVEAELGPLCMQLRRRDLRAEGSMPSDREAVLEEAALSRATERQSRLSKHYKATRVLRAGHLGMLPGPSRDLRDGLSHPESKLDADEETRKKLRFDDPDAAASTSDRLWRQGPPRGIPHANVHALTISRASKARNRFSGHTEWQGGRTRATMTLLPQSAFDSPQQGLGKDKEMTDGEAALARLRGGATARALEEREEERKGVQVHAGMRRSGRQAADYRAVVAALRPLSLPKEDLTSRVLYIFDVWDVGEREWMPLSDFAEAMLTFPRTDGEALEVLLGVETLALVIGAKRKGFLVPSFANMPWWSRHNPPETCQKARPWLHRCSQAEFKDLLWPRQVPMDGRTFPGLWICDIALQVTRTEVQEVFDNDASFPLARTLRRIFWQHWLTADKRMAALDVSMLRSNAIARDKIHALRHGIVEKKYMENKPKRTLRTWQDYLRESKSMSEAVWHHKSRNCRSAVHRWVAWTSATRTKKAMVAAQNEFRMAVIRRRTWTHWYGAFHMKVHRDTVTEAMAAKFFKDLWQLKGFFAWRQYVELNLMKREDGMVRGAQFYARRSLVRAFSALRRRISQLVSEKHARERQSQMAKEVAEGEAEAAAFLAEIEAEKAALEKAAQEAEDEARRVAEEKAQYEKQMVKQRRKAEAKHKLRQQAIQRHRHKQQQWQDTLEAFAQTWKFIRARAIDEAKTEAAAWQASRAGQLGIKREAQDLLAETHDEARSRIEAGKGRVPNSPWEVLMTGESNPLGPTLFYYNHETDIRVMFADLTLEFCSEIVTQNYVGRKVTVASEVIEKRQTDALWELKMDRFAARIQHAARRFLARRKLRLAAKGAFLKYRDPGSGHAYYVNVRTGQSQWRRPFAFGSSDVPYST